jgi:hypothetical protein
MDEALAAQTIEQPLYPPAAAFLRTTRLLVFAVHVTEMAKLGPKQFCPPFRSPLETPSPLLAGEGLEFNFLVTFGILLHCGRCNFLTGSNTRRVYPQPHELLTPVPATTRLRGVGAARPATV